MPLPDFDAAGDLPPGVHRATLDEVSRRFGVGSEQRGICARRLIHLYQLARRTERLERFVIFGSYVTARPCAGSSQVWRKLILGPPRDVDAREH